MERIFVIGATGKVGRAVVGRLVERGIPIVAVGRSLEGFASLEASETRLADLTDRRTMTAALADARRLVCCAHARFVPALLEALPSGVERVVALGSTRKFTRFPDAATEEVRLGEAAFVRSGVPGVMIHPTMIYGSPGENNVQRIAAHIKRFGVVPLPRGGRASLQPIHIEDVAACIEAALARDEAIGAPIVVAGPAPVSYRIFVELIARANRRPVRVVSLPAPLLIALAAATPLLPMSPRVTVAEVRRLLEEKVFDISEMRRRLAIEPIALERGLELTLAD